MAPVYFQVKRGEVILRAGDKVKEEDLLKISALKKAQARSHLVSILLGLGLLAFLILASLYQFSVMNIRKFILSQQKDFLLFSSALVSMIGLLKLFQLITDVLEGNC